MVVPKQNKSKIQRRDDGSFASFSERRREKGEVFASTVTEPESVGLVVPIIGYSMNHPLR